MKRKKDENVFTYKNGSDLAVEPAPAEFAVAKDILVRWFSKCDFSCLVPQYTSITLQITLLSTYFMSRAPIELSYIEKLAFIRNVYSEKVRLLNPGVKRKKNGPFYDKVSVQKG